MTISSTAINKTTIADGPEVATEELEGVIFQHVKLDWGADGARYPVSAATPMPVTFSDAIDVSGSSVSVSSSALPTGAATQATLASVLAAVAAAATEATLAAINAKLPALVGGRVSVDGSGVTQPVSAAALPLPSGAATAAKQPALGTAGGASADVLSVQGIASMTPLLVTPGGNVAHDAADSGNPVKMGAKASSGLPAEVSSADRVDLATDLNSRLLMAHITPAMQVKYPFRYTSAQTGTNLWDPTSGKRIAITHIILGSGATTAGRLILWFGANGDTTYTAGTDQLIFDLTFTPSASATPGAVLAFPVPIFCTTADYEVHVTTDAGLTIGGVVYGYEW